MNNILFYDSGIGGVSVLRLAQRTLPKENFIYYGDSKNAPYGERSADEVCRLVLENVAGLVARLCPKAIVIACNTATSAAIGELRSRYPNLIVIGMEPALKPAVKAYPGGNIAVLATPITIREEKFRTLCGQYYNEANIIPIECAGLMDFAERGEFNSPELQTYLNIKLDGALCGGLSAVVLGCTHYAFLAEAISQAAREAEIFDGGDGTVRELVKRLTEKDLFVSEGTGSVAFLNSLNDEEKNEQAKKLCFE
ncbi:MAG: glutamate racemase [Oscillospiraceae bacterium]|nr:glutamate racemase [Oscillospiraceae bacterium]